MNPARVEEWAWRVIERIKAGQPIEDSRVECKRVWIPDPWKVARQLAGSANAARGDMVLWLIGVDEVAGLVGVMHEELSNWYPQVRAHFADGAAPTMVHVVNVTENERTAVALLFESDRAPYVVKLPDGGRDTPGGGKVTLEVPWRENNATRSATHADLIRLLVPLQRRPDVEVLDGSIEMTQFGEGRQAKTVWNLTLRFYVIPQSPGRITIPFHHSQLTLAVRGCLEACLSSEHQMNPLYAGGYGIYSMNVPPPPPRALSATIIGTETEVHIDGPGLVRLTANWSAAGLREPTREDSAHLSGRLQPVNADFALTFAVDFKVIPPTQPNGRWIWQTPVG